MDILNFPGIQGLPGILLTLIAMIIYGIYIQRSARSKAQQLANTAYDNAIKAMQVHTDTLEKRVRETEEENKQLRQMQETIFDALKTRDIYITVLGRHAINIREGKETTMIRIDEEK